MSYKILTPTVTIFNEDETIDYQGNKKVIEFLIENGVDGLVPLGSTGEFPDMTYDDRKEFLKFYLDQVNKRVEVLPGTSSINYDEVVELSNYVFELGADGVLVIPPYYFGISQDEVYRYFDRLAGDLKGNLYIYNFEARSGFDIDSEVLLKLALKHKNIKGMKDSTGSAAHTKECIYKVLEHRPDFEVYSGFDDHFIPNIMAGGVGCISAISNILPELWSQWVKETKAGNFDQIVAIQNKIDDLMKLYSIDSNFSLLFKKLMKERGVEINTTTLFPFDQIDDDKYEQAKEIFNRHFK